MMKMELALLRSKFRGSMLGVLVGDCIGSPYEGEETLTPGMKTVLQQSFDKLERVEFKGLGFDNLFLFSHTISRV